MIITRPNDLYATPLDELDVEILPLSINNLYDLDFRYPLLNQFAFPEDWAQWFHDKVKDEIGVKCSRRFLRTLTLSLFINYQSSWKIPTQNQKVCNNI